MLRNPTCCVDYSRVDFVAKFIQRFGNRLPCPALVMRLQILDVLKKQYWWAFHFNYGDDVEEQCALRSTLESVCLPRLFFFATPAIENG